MIGSCQIMKHTPHIPRENAAGDFMQATQTKIESDANHMHLCQFQKHKCAIISYCAQKFLSAEYISKE